MSDATPSGGWSRSPDNQRRYDLIWGLVIAVLGLILLITSFMVQNLVPLTVRGAITIIMTVGVAASARWLCVLSPRGCHDGTALVPLAPIAIAVFA
jgi:hypothetical protein